MMPSIFMMRLRFANPFMTLETIDLFIRAGVHEIDVKKAGIFKPPKPNILRTSLEVGSFTTLK